MPAVSSRKVFSYADAMGGSLRLYVENFRLFLSLSFSITGLLVLRTVLDATGLPFCKAAGSVITPLAFGTGALFYMALILAVAKGSRKELVSFAELVQEVFPKFWRAVGAATIFFIILILGMVLFVIPGLYWLTVIYFFLYLITLEDKRLWDSFEASAGLVKGHFWRVLGAHGLMAVIAIAFLMPFYMGMWLIGVPQAWRDPIFQVLGVLLMPFSVGVYYQLFVWLKEQDQHAGHIAVVETK